MGGEFKEDTESTEGIITHIIESSFDKNETVEHKWNEKSINTEERLQDFHNFIISRTGERRNGRVNTQMAAIGTGTGMAANSDTVRNVYSKDLSESRKESNESPVALTPLPTLKDDKDTMTRRELEQSSLQRNIFPVETMKESTKSSQSTLDMEQDILTFQDQTPQLKREMSEKEWEQLLSYRDQLVEKEEHVDSIPYTISLWDLGGQDEFIPTHHFFLDAEDTTLLVMDISKNFTKPLSPDTKKEGVPETPKDILCYWLNTIHGLASEKGLQPNIGLVLTHKDEIPSDDPEQYIECFKSKILKAIERKPYQTFITMENIYVVDNKYGRESDFNKLRRDVFKMMTKQKSWGMETSEVAETGS